MIIFYCCQIDNELKYNITNMNTQNNDDIQLMTINYRNAIYQGYFNRYYQHREGFGLLYTTDTNMIMGTFWEDDQANQATLIYYNQSNYMYGFWKDNRPHGFNSVRMDKIIFFAFYHQGHIQDHILIIFQHWNVAVVLAKKSQHEFQVLSKGDILSDNDFNRFVQMCNWPQFHEQWKTLIKFTLSYLSSESSGKSNLPKLRLVNKTFYRYGYNEGLAIIFDDQCKILSLGIHKHTKLTSIGILYNKKKFIEEGNFNKSNEVLSYNYDHRPELKLYKIYSNFLLSSSNFVNKFISNPAKMAIQYLQKQKKTNLLNNIISQLAKNNIQLKKFHQITAQQDSQQSIELNKNDQNRLKQQKQILQIYKNQIKQQLKFKYKLSTDRSIPQLTPQNQSLVSMNNSRIIHKPRVELVSQDSTKTKKNNIPKGKLRSPIFTSQKLQQKKIQLSPFRQKIHLKIFQNKKKWNNSSPQYHSPHQQLQFSQFSQHTDPQALPLTWKNKQEFANHPIFKQDKRKKSKQPIFFNDNTQINNNNNNNDKNNKNNNNINNNNNNNKILFFNNKQPNNLNSNQQGIITNTNIDNIVIVSHSQNNTPKRVKPQENNNEHSYKINRRKNEVYLTSQARFKKLPEQVNYNPIIEKNKQIKGYTYLQQNKQNIQKIKLKYQISKQQQKYNRTIKNFNKNNKLYTLTQSQSQSHKKMPINRINSKLFIQDQLYINKNNNYAQPKKIYNYQHYHH